MNGEGSVPTRSLQTCGSVLTRGMPVIAMPPA